jgi:RNA-binding protein YlmH
MEKITLTVQVGDQGKRLDVYLTEFTAGQQLGLSRTLIQHAILAGKATVNMAVSIKPHHKLKAGDTVVSPLRSCMKMRIWQ